MESRTALVLLMLLVMNMDEGMAVMDGKAVVCMTSTDLCELGDETIMANITKVVINPFVISQLGFRSYDNIQTITLHAVPKIRGNGCYWNNYANMAPKATVLELIDLACEKVNLNMAWKIPVIRGLTVAEHVPGALENLGGQQILEYEVRQGLKGDKLFYSPRKSESMTLIIHTDKDIHGLLMPPTTSVGELTLIIPDVERFVGFGLAGILQLETLTMEAPRLYHVSRGLLTTRFGIKRLNWYTPLLNGVGNDNPLVNASTRGLNQLQWLNITQQGYPSELACQLRSLTALRYESANPSVQEQPIKLKTDVSYQSIELVNVNLTEHPIKSCAGGAKISMHELILTNTASEQLKHGGLQLVMPKALVIQSDWGSEVLNIPETLTQLRALTLRNITKQALYLNVETTGLQELTLENCDISQLIVAGNKLTNATWNLQMAGLQLLNINCMENCVFTSLNASHNVLTDVKIGPTSRVRVDSLDLSDNLLTRTPAVAMQTSQAGVNMPHLLGNPLECTFEGLLTIKNSMPVNLSRAEEPEWLHQKCHYNGVVMDWTISQCMNRLKQCMMEWQSMKTNPTNSPFVQQQPGGMQRPPGVTTVAVTTTMRKRSSDSQPPAHDKLDLGQGAALFPELGLVFQNMGTLRHSGQSLTLNIIMQTPELTIQYPENLVHLETACSQVTEAYASSICTSYMPMLQRATQDAQKLHNQTIKHMDDLKTLMINPQLTLKGPRRRQKRFVFTTVLGLLGPALLSGATRLATHVIERKRVNDLRKGAELVMQRQDLLSQELVAVRQNLAAYAQASDANNLVLQRQINITATRMQQGQERLSKMIRALANETESVSQRVRSIAILAELSLALSRTQLINIGNYRSMIAALVQMTQAVTDLHRGRLNTALMGANDLRGLVTKAAAQLFDWMPEYRLDVESVDQLFNLDTVLVLSSSELNMLEWQIALPVVKRNAHPLALYKVIPFAVPVKTVSKVTADGPRLTYASYTIVRPEAHYIAFEGDYYVTLTIDEREQCESSWDSSQFRCPFHLIETQRARRTCLSEVYYGSTVSELVKLCQIDYLTQRLPEPSIIQVNDKVILSGLQPPFSLRCSSDSQPKPLKDLFFVILEAAVLCNCDIASRTEFVQRQFCVSEHMGPLNYTIIGNAIANVVMQESMQAGKGMATKQLDWSSETISKMFDDMTIDDIADGVSLQSLVLATNMTSSFEKDDRELRQQQQSALQSFSLSTTGYVLTLALGIVGTLSWIAFCIVCARQLTGRQMMTALTLGLPKGTAACESLQQTAWQSTQHALVTIGVAITLYFLVWILKKIFTKLGADSAPRLTDTKFNKCPRLTVYLEIGNGLERVMLPVAALHVTLEKVVLIGAANPRMAALSRHPFGWHIRFTAFNDEAALRVHGQPIRLPMVVPVPLLYRKKVDRICGSDPTLHLWLVDTFGIAYLLESSTTASAPPPEYGEDGELALTWTATA